VAKVDPVRGALYPDDRVGLQQVRGAVAQIGADVRQLLRRAGAPYLCALRGAADVEDGRVVKVKQMRRVGSDEVLVVRLLVQVSDELALQQRMQVDLRFFHAHQPAFRQGGRSGQDHDLVDAGAEVVKRQRNAAPLYQDHPGIVRHLQACRCVLQHRLQELIDRPEPPLVGLMVQIRALQALQP
jgi:hypothetical protein